MDYYPYGATRIATSTYPTNEKRQYIGQFSDAQTSLDYLNARYYDPMRGQFISQDPVFLGDPKQQNLTDPQSFNTYSYAVDNPATKKDPTGKFWDFSSAFTISPPMYPGVSIAFDFQVDRGGGYSLNLQPGFGWGAYGKPLQIYHGAGPVTASQQGASTVGSDFFFIGWSADPTTGIANPNVYGFGAGVDVYTRWNFTLLSNVKIPPASSNQLYYPNQSISTFKYYSLQTRYFSNGNSSAQSRDQAVQAYNATIGGTYGSSPGAYGYSSSGTAMPNPNSVWTTPSGAIVTWSGQLVSPPSKR